MPFPLPTSFPHFAGAATPQVVFFFLCALGFALFAALGRERPFFNKSSYLWTMTACFICGVMLLGAALPLLSPTPAIELFLFFFGSTLACMGFCSIHVEFGRLMGYLGMTHTLVFSIGSTILSLPITLALLLLPPIPMLLAIAVLACILTYTLDAAINREGRAKVYFQADITLSIPWRFMITSFAQGVSVGLLFALFTSTTQLTVAGESLASVIAASLAFVFGLALRIDFDRLVYRIGFSILGVGCLLYAIAGTNAGLQLLSVLVQLTFYVYTDAILWSLGSYLIKSCSQPAIWVAACPSASLLVGRCIGGISGNALACATFPGQTVFSNNPAEAAAAIAAFAFTFLALQLSSGENVRTGWGFIKPIEDGEAPSKLEQTCLLLAEDFHLTQRERDVLLLIASGKSRSEAAAELYVTTNTVKTHLRNVYTKLGTHSREELMQFIEHQQRVFNTHGE